jgi:tetratricopeptide (TPR) repeat protein
LPALAQPANVAALCKSDKTDKGIAACTTILKGRGDRKVKASALLSRAQAYWASKRLAEAEKDYSEAIRMAPNFAALYRDRGQIRFGLGNQAGAMADFTAAIENDPFDPDNHANRGYLKLLQDDFGGAEEDFRKGLFWNKPHPRSEYFIGLLHYARGRYGDAISVIDVARSHGYKGNEAFITKARSLFYMGAFESAAKEATEGLQTFPTIYDLTEIRARARLARRELADALADAEAVIQAAPNYGRAYATRGAVKLAMKDLAAAKADAEKAIALDAKLFDAYELKAEILLAGDDKAGARAIYQASAARADAKMAYDEASRERAAARVVEFDKPKPILVTDLDETGLKARCETRDDPLRLASCDRLVELAATPQLKADMLILRSRAKPPSDQLGDLELAVAAAPDYLAATLARAHGHTALYRYDADMAPLDRAWADADSVVRRASPGSDDLSDALDARALVSSLKGAYEPAVADLTRLLEKDGAAAYYRDQRASALLMASKPAQALEDLQALRKLAGDEGKLLMQPGNLVVALLETGKVDEALAELDAWARAGSSGAVAREALRARAMLMRGDVAAARSIAEAALTANPLNFGALAVRGLASARLGSALDAASDLTKVIDDIAGIPFKSASRRFTPGFTAELFLHRGMARAQLNQGNAARADFAEAIKRAPDRARAYAERARVLYRADNPAALTDIAMALRIEPDEPRWQALAARINLATGDFAASERFATAALAAPAPAPEADLRLLRAQARMSQKKFAEALDDANARLAGAPSDADALVIRIEARSGMGDLKAALADAEAARAANRSDARILLALADLKSRTGDVPGAIGAFEEAALQADTAMLANKRLGDLYVGLSSDQLALGYYAKALEASARATADEALRSEARAARDGLIRKMSASK